jgi:hypothetical protein
MEVQVGQVVDHEHAMLLYSRRFQASRGSRHPRLAFSAGYQDWSPNGQDQGIRMSAANKSANEVHEGASERASPRPPQGLLRPSLPGGAKPVPFRRA